MRTLSFVLLALASPLALASLPTLASAQVSGVMHQRVVGLLGPMGAEHALSLGLRTTLGDPAELLFSGTYADAGIIEYTSPIYSLTGGWVEVSPLAFLILRAEITGSAHWPIGVSGAGYYPVASYDADLDGENLSASRGESATGWNVHLSATLQGALPLATLPHGPMRLVLWNQLSFDRIELGSAPFHFYPRFDMVLAREDWVIGNWGMALLEVPLAEGVSARVGIYDDARVVPRSGFVVNQVGLIAMLPIENADPAVPLVTPFVRAGGYTNGRRAESFTLLLGLMARYDLGSITD